MTAASVVKIILAVIWFIVGLCYKFGIFKASQEMIIFLICVLIALVTVGGVE